MKQSISPLDWQNLEKTNKKVADKLEDYYATWQKEQLEKYSDSHLIFDHISKWLTIGRLIEILDREDGLSTIEFLEGYYAVYGRGLKDFAYMVRPNWIDEELISPLLDAVIDKLS